MNCGCTGAYGFFGAGPGVDLDAGWLAGTCGGGCEIGDWPPEAGVELGVVAGVFGAGFAGCETFLRTEPPWQTLRSVRSTRAMAQSMNIPAHHVVALDKTLAAPRGPKAVWLPAPPKAPARSAALPLCSRTAMMSTMHFITKKPVR